MTDHPEPSTDEELTPEQELQLAFGRALGFAAVAIVLLVGGGIALILIGALFFGFIYGP